MTLVAYVLRNWVHMQIVFATFSSLMVVLYFMVRPHTIVSSWTLVVTQPIWVSLWAHSLSVATLVVVSDGIDVWVALRFLYH